MKETTLKKTLLILLLAIPAAGLTYAALSNSLGPDPADVLVDETGEWVLRLLIVTLAMTPMAKWMRSWEYTRSWKPIRYRRILGVTTWVYGVLHLLSYCAFLLAWRWSEIGDELVERPYIAVGFAAILIMTPLAVTSTDSMVRRLGRRWKSLHKAIYAVAILAMAHIVWQVRSDYGEALVYSLIIIALLVWRLRERRVRATG